MFDSSHDEYKRALKLGKKSVAERLKKKLDPYPAALEELCGDLDARTQTSVGLIEVPAELIVGTKSSARKSSFSYDFMPLLKPESEFASKWMALYDKMVEEGMRDPVQLVEYLGVLYVAEGNKRVSVMRYNGGTSIPAEVMRVTAADEADELYLDFLGCFEKTGLYQVRFEHAGCMPKLQDALGFEEDHVWTENECKSFLASYSRFEVLYRKRVAGKDEFPAPMDAFLALIMYLPIARLKEYTEKELAVSVKYLVASFEVLKKAEKRARRRLEAGDSE